MVPLTSPVKGTVNTLSSPKEGGKQNKASTCKSSEKYTETGSISANEYGCNSILTEKTENDNLPKIVEVYSLNSRKSNAQDPGLLKSNTQGGLSCKNEETFMRNGDMFTNQPSKSLLQDTNTGTHSSQMKPYLVSDNFIDLTIDDEEETKSCNDDDIARPGDENLYDRNVNVGDQSEFDRLGEDKGDKEQQNKKSGQCKRKGVFGSRRKGKRRCPTQNQKQKNTNKSLNAGWDFSGCNSDNLIQGDQDKTQCRVLNDQQYTFQGNGEEKLNDLKKNYNIMKEETDSTQNTEERKEHWNGNMINGGIHISSDMTYRDNKITTLKARLAKQEEELARLRTQKECNMAKVKSLEAPDQDIGQEKVESEADDWSNKVHHKRQEATKDDPVEVNLDDICQHVIKSFVIFNARQGESKTRKKEGFHTVHEENAGIMKEANERKSDFNDVAYLPQGKQEEFLFHIGLRKRWPSNN